MQASFYIRALNRLSPNIRRQLSWLKNGLPKTLAKPVLSAKANQLNAMRFYHGRHRVFSSLYFFPTQCALYVEIPKAASSKILASMLELSGHDIPADVNAMRALVHRHSAVHCDNQTLYDLLLEKKVFCFTFVRNPYRRIYSAYKDKILHTHTAPNDSYYEEYKKICRRIQKPIGEPVSFQEFVEYVCQQHDADMNVHWLPQIAMGWFDRIAYDFIGKVENFDTDFMHVLTQLKAPSAMAQKTTKKENPTTETTPIENAYDAAMRDKIYTRYKEDFEAFGYRKDAFN